MTVKVSFVTHVCDLEFSDEQWILIESAARVNNQTVEEWMNSAISSYIQNFEEE